MAPMKWTDDRLVVLRAMVRQKLTGTQIAERFGIGCSAVIAAIDRACKADPTFPRLQAGRGGRRGKTNSHSPAGTSSRLPENSPGRATSSPSARGASTAESVISPPEGGPKDGRDEWLARPGRAEGGITEREARETTASREAPRLTIPPSGLPPISPSRGEIMLSAAAADQMEDGAIGAVKGAARLPDAVGVEPPSSATLTLSAGVTLMELTAWHCRWPMPGDIGAAQRFCGCRRVEGRPYCAEHVARARGAGNEGERAAARIGRAA